MRRGERKLWRAAAESSAKVAGSTDYAQEYIYSVQFAHAVEALFAFGREVLNQHEGKPGAEEPEDATPNRRESQSVA